MSVPEKISALREALGGRRFLMTIGAGVVSTFLVMHGEISEGTWLEALKWTVAVYIAGRTINEVKDAFTPNGKTPPVGSGGPNGPAGS